MKFVKKKVLTDNLAQEIDNEFNDLNVFNFNEYGENFENELENKEELP